MMKRKNEGINFMTFFCTEVYSVVGRISLYSAKEKCWIPFNVKPATLINNCCGLTTIVLVPVNDLEQSEIVVKGSRNLDDVLGRHVQIQAVFIKDEEGREDMISELEISIFD